MENKTIVRCFGSHNPAYARYHDEEWGVPSHRDVHLFEMLTLEGAQAGLNWETILMKREGYKKSFHNFDIQKIAIMSDESLDALKENPEIIRNKRKIHSVRKNAQVAIEIQEEYGSLNAYFWGFVGNKSIKNNHKTIADIPTISDESIALSKDLKKRGMSFIGPTIMYAFMQATGMIIDHPQECWRFEKK